MASSEIEVAEMFAAEEMRVEQGLGYPRAYSKLCRDRGFGPYKHAPPFTFTPYALSHHQALRAKDLDEMFPIIDPKAKPTAKPKIFASLLWKQLNHLGNAGFDPATFRFDTYGNVLYYHADPASPLAWNIDHWFPCSRGGLTVPSNLRILQKQVCKKKHNKLEFLIPWWDFQVGVSINQFLSVFASSNSDFRHRAFSLLFMEGESEELNDSQTVDSHIFPQHFIDSKEQVGLAPAAVVLSRRESFDTSSAPKAHNINSLSSCSSTPFIGARKLKTRISKENEDPNMVTNPYQAMVKARNSLKHQEETTKMQGEIQKLDDEVNELIEKTDEEKLTIQDLELILIKKRRRAEKCRRLAEAQSSYRSMLEKMIRDAMHQSVIYKEQVRLNQAASNALMARLEAQKAICDFSERELHKKFKQRDELKSLVRPDLEKARKRSRMSDSLFEGKNDKTILYLPGSKQNTHPKTKLNEISLEEKDDKLVLCLPATDSETPHLHKELRVFLEEEQKAYEEALSKKEEDKEEEQEIEEVKCDELKNAVATMDIGNLIESKLQKLKIEEDQMIDGIRVKVLNESDGDNEDDESRKLRGKGNVEKWLQMLLEDSEEPNFQNTDERNTFETDELIRKLSLKYPNKTIKIPNFLETLDEEGLKQRAHEKGEEDLVDVEARKLQFNNLPTVGEREWNKLEEETGEVEAINTHLPNPPYKLTSRKSFEMQERRLKEGGKDKGRELVRCKSSRSFRRIPSSPSIILKKGVDCIRKKKPLVLGGDGEDHHNNATTTNNFIRSSINSFKKAVNI